METKDLYALLVETVTDYGIFVLDAEGRVRTWNPGARRLKGYEASEIIGEHFSKFYPQEARDRHWPEQELAIAKVQGRFEDEGWRIRKDGSRFWANVVITALHDGTGELVGFSKITRDLTERRRQEESLRQSEERMRLMIETVEDYAIFMLEPDGKVASWNAGAQRIKGYSAREIIGRHFSTFYPREALDRKWPEHELKVAAAEGRFEDEGWRVRKDGSQFWANVVITALYDRAGALRGFAKVTRDLTERRQREEALLQSEARLRLLIEGVQDYAIFMLDPHGRVASWNTGAQRIKGYTAEEIVGHHFSVFYPPEALERRWPEHELSVAKAEGRFEDEGWRVRKDGSQFWANVVITALRDPGGELLGFAKITRDLTQRRQVEELRTSERRMQEFLAMLGHELRNPLAPISASLQVLLKSQSADTEEELAKRVMQRQLGQLTRVVEDLLDVSRVTQASIRLRRQPMDLVSAVHSAAEAARPWIDSHGHQLTVKLPDHPVQIEADEQRLNQVLLNLLNNAAKYTPPGGRIEVELATHSRLAEIRVRDTGIGISPDLLETVFDLFVQGERDLARVEGGLGVGLTLVKQLVHLHGGTVEAHSDGAGKGSEFVVRLPMPHSIEMPAAREQVSHSKAAASSRILIVDDNADAADMLAILLKEAGHEVRTAPDGHSALPLAEDFRPQVVLLDIGLPGMNGYDVAQRMRKLPGLAEATYIAVTGYGQSSDRQASARAGIDHHLVKPVEAKELLQLIGGALRQPG